MNMATVKEPAFILVNGEYQEISVNKLIRGGKWLPPYDTRYFLRLHGYLMEVKEEDHIKFRRDMRREKYLREEAELHNQFSYNSADTDEYSGEELIVDILTNVEDEAMRLYMIELVGEMVRRLPADDYALIHALYYTQISETKFASQIGISQQAVSLRKHAILKMFQRKLCR